MKREFSEAVPELMDLPQPVSAELEKDLANLEELNRHFGGHTIWRHFARRWLRPGRAYRMLDLATGAGDGPRFFAQYAARHGVALIIDAVDLHPSTLAIARQRSAAFSSIRWIEGDAFEFQAAEPYDLVCCSLALHHFSEAQATALLRRCASLSRQYVLVADLERSRLTSVCVWLATAVLYRDAMTKYDGRLSARRAFSCAELKAMARGAGWAAFGHRRYLPARQAIWLE